MRDKPTVLPSKLYRPPTLRDHVRRELLVQRLDEGAEKGLTLICAPAGYGKSTLVSDWVGSSDRPWAWLSLDDRDSELENFLLALGSALRTMFANVASQTLAMLDAEIPPQPHEFAEALVSELSEITEDYTLVLDDYQAIQDARVHDVLSEVLRHPPPHLKLVLISRMDPPLPLGRLRAQAALTEIRLHDLRFSVEEALRFLRMASDTEIDPRVAQVLNGRTEGWVAGLRLASLSLGDPASLDRLVSSAGGDSRYIRDYLMSEVLSRQAPAMRQCLLRCSILRQFCAALCDELGEIDGDPESGLSGSSFLERAREQNLFLISLDDGGGWFRFHHLFRDLLLHQLEQRSSKEEIASFHRRAACWLADRGDLDEAVRHYLLAGERRSAADVVRRGRHELMATEKWHQLDRLLSVLPAEIVRSEPELLVQHALNAENRFRYREMFQFIQEIERLVAEQETTSRLDPALASEVDVLRAIRMYVVGDGKAALSAGQRALDSLPRRFASQRGMAAGISIMASQMVGEAPEALRWGFDILAGEGRPAGTFASRVLISLCHLHWMEADLSRLRRTAEQLLAMAQRASLDEARDFAEYFLGIARYELDELQPAKAHLSRIAAQRYSSNIQNQAHCVIPLALICQEEGEIERARQLVHSAATQALASHNEDQMRLAEAGEAELALRAGELPQVQRWAASFEISAKPTRWRFFLPELTLAKLRLAEGTHESLDAAEELLAHLLAHARASHGRRSLIDILALQALLKERRNETAEAFASLQEALALAQSSGIVRPFLDLGSPMAVLLVLAAQGGVHVPYVGRLLEIFRKRTIPRRGSAVAGSLEPGEGPADLPGMEPLTRREAQILALLAERLSDKEIAERLYIAPGTVKKHLGNLYSKLDVHDRLQAVSRARELRLL
jgi:LuxR family maltose regulon positive regulatory protein